MNRLISLIIVLYFINISAIAQMSSIQTSTNNCIQGKFKTFIILDENTNFVMAQKPVPYQVGQNMPLSYFSYLFLNGASGYLPGAPRSTVIHTLQAGTGLAEKDWVLEENIEEEAVFFARNKYITNVFSKQWLIKVDGKKVIFQNLRTNGYLMIDKNGDYHTTNNFRDATRWKLIYTY